MIAARRTVEAARELLAAGMLTDEARAAGVAREYARFCAESARRLAVCARFLARGLAGEALQAARNPPDLNELCATLSFAEAGAWRDLCQRRGWAVAEPLDAAVLERLREAAGAAEARDPLVQQYRAAVRRHDDAEAVAALRRLAELEPSNAIWLEDLRRFEKKRMAAVEEECRRALAADEVPRLRALLDELSGRWLVPVRPRIRQEIVARLEAVRAREAEAEAARQQERLGAAREAGDVAAVRAAVEDWRRLLAQGAVAPGPGHAEAVEAAWAWAEDRQREQAREATAAAKLQELRDALEKADPSRDLAPLWNTIQAMRVPVPADVKRRAREAIDAYRRRAEARRRLRQLRSAAVAATLLAVVGAVAWWAVLRGATVDWSKRLQESFERRDLPAFQRAKAELDADRRWLFGGLIGRSAAVRDWLAREGELAQAHAAKMADRDAAWRELDGIRDGGFAAPRATIDEWLALARRHAAGPEDAARTAAFEQQWKEAKGRELDALAREMEERVPEGEAARGLGAAEWKERLDAATNLLARARALDFLDDDGHARLDRLNDRILTATRLAAAREGKGRELAAADSVATLVTLAETMIKSWPDDPMAPGLQAIIERRALYQQLAAVGPSKAYAAPTARIPFEKLITDVFYPSLPADNALWSGLMENLVGQHKKLAAKWPAVRDALKALGDDVLLVGLWQYEEAGSGELCFAQLPYGDTAAAVGDTSATVDAKVYAPAAIDRSATFAARTVARSAMRNLKPMAHCRILAKVVAEAPDVDAGEGDVYLLRRLRDIATDADIASPLLQVKLLRFFSEQFLALGVAPLQSDRIREMAGALARLDDKVKAPWLCTKTRAVEEAADEARRTVASFFADGAVPWGAYEFERAIQATALGRGARFAGIARGDGGLPDALSGKPPELWVVRGDASGAPQVLVAAERQEDGALGIVQAPDPYEPLFAPGGTLTTREAVRACAVLGGVANVGTAAVQWPAVWPANRRE